MDVTGFRLLTIAVTNFRVYLSLLDVWRCAVLFVCLYGVFNDGFSRQYAEGSSYGRIRSEVQIKYLFIASQIVR